MSNPVLEEETVELRFNVPLWVAEVLDAHCAAKRMHRTVCAKGVMAHWAKEEVHLAMVIGRVTRGNGNVTPDGWVANGS
jgi:hypothetical protein